MQSAHNCMPVQGHVFSIDPGATIWRSIPDDAFDSDRRCISAEIETTENLLQKFILYHRKYICTCYLYENIFTLSFQAQLLGIYKAMNQEPDFAKRKCFMFTS